ncbi:MAG: BlaI/MecI/CopY family transcriptional regulator [Verrucomicrobiota bacterium]|nr:BlaI/MecI/CopY family transcriptional regulator [Verrucomicrobiota bacterium]
MHDPSKLSRRERQIMDIIYAASEATVRQVQARLPEPPTDMAVRRMLQILEEKGQLRRRPGREAVYMPAQSKARAGIRALQHVLDTFFSGAVDEALAAHLASKEPASPEQLVRMRKLIEEARKEGR